jgi:nitrile hydratase
MLNPEQEEFCKLWGELVQRSWYDEDFRQTLINDPTGVLAEHGYRLPHGSQLRLEVVVSDEREQVLYLPCEAELVDPSSTQQAGEVAADCMNNRLTMARLLQTPYITTEPDVGG